MDIMYSDLHFHLGSGVHPSDLWEIAHQQGIALPRKMKNYHDFVNNMLVGDYEEHNDYLNRFRLTHDIQSSPEAIRLSVYSALKRCYTEHDIDLLEIRFNPMLRNKNGYYDLDMLIFNAHIAIEKARLIYPLNSGIILGIERSFSRHEATEILRKALGNINKGVIGIDVSGKSPKNFDPLKFKDVYLMAKEKGLKTTIHAGEVTDLEEMEIIIKELKPDRIGHGVLAHKSEKIMNMLAENDITLEICPTSNVKLGVVKSYKDFKDIFRKFNEHGVKYTINTDGTTFLNTDIKSEYKKLVENGVISCDDVPKLEITSRESSFIKNII